MRLQLKSKRAHRIVIRAEFPDAPVRFARELGVTRVVETR
jgi:hypothetical protein